MSEKLLFGTGGIPLSSRSPTTESGIERVAELGLGCMEVQFVRGVKMSEEMARRVGDVAKSKGVRLTAHAPYFINLNSDDTEKIMASKERLIQTARIASHLGAEGVVFHAAFYLNDPHSAVYATVKQALEEMVKLLAAEGNRVLLRPETTGKESQFGTVEEILNLSAEIEGIAPCIDFAHLHARAGKSNSYEEFVSLLKMVEGRLGRQALDNIHIHIAGVEYGKMGEIRHLNLKESDLNYVELLKALKDLGVNGLVICESPNLEGDALLLQETYNSL
ncbi:MAG: TIM barrel protein [Dehalococcoidia bacterium]